MTSLQEWRSVPRTNCLGKVGAATSDQSINRGNRGRVALVAPSTKDTEAGRMERGARDDHARMPTNQPVSDDEGPPPPPIRSADWATFAACRSRLAPDLSEAAAGPVA